jgi:RHS repeat-associated protein
MTRVNPMRWSTQYTDDETDLVMYAKRPYNPSSGHFLSRDPIEEDGGNNLYGFVANSPVNRVDVLGLWHPGDHETMTRTALNSAQMPLAYKRKMADLLVKENARVDNEWMDDNYWHFNRGLSEDIDVAITAYVAKLCGHNEDIHRYLASPNRVNCAIAFAVMGNLSHAYQDYYAHAISRGSDGSASSIGLLTGTPDSPGPNMKPSSWGGFWNPGEHQRPPSEPGSRATDAASRKAGAQSYTATQFQDFARDWWHACKCYAKDIFGQ